ncbi:hypothetical protein DBR06_SOUSAS1210075, partial [Sousa chinensis]
IHYNCLVSRKCFSQTSDLYNHENIYKVKKIHDSGKCSNGFI